MTLRQLSASALVVALVAVATTKARPARGAGPGRGTAPSASAGAADDDDGVDPAILKRKARPRLGLPDKQRGTLAATEGATRCGACHLVEGWEKVRFNHDPTGFPLRGAHVDVTCNACHTKTFETPLANTCSGCHRDRHGGEFGLHCEGCHDEKSWRPLFQADAHRRTNFPLVGKHALIPCNECHGNLRDRTFTRAATGCYACHQTDFMRTTALAIDHVAGGYSHECQTCHNTFRFFPASVRAHDTCFRMSGGPHQAMRCQACHTSFPGPPVFTGICHNGPPPYVCSECHSHNCPRSDSQHKNVMAYQCSDMKCAECHQPGRL